MRTRLTSLFGISSSAVAVDFITYTPMKLIIGLGNPGSQYSTTRHNVGFLMIDELIRQYDGTGLLYQKKFNAELATGMIGKRQVLYVKPQTFMNRSGSSIASLVNFYKLEKEDILVIQDDIDHMFGKIKLKYGGSHGGHNGIRDTIDHLGSQKFRRLKLGVGRPSGKQDVSDYVLGKMKDDEMKYRADHLPDVFGQVEQWLKNVG